MRREATFRTLLLLVSASAFALAVLAPWTVKAWDNHGEHEDEYVQTNLVSNGYVSAEITDSNLVNPWGVAASSTSPIWVSNQTTSTSTLYSLTNIENGVGSPFVVAIPTTGTLGPQGPTGIVFNTFAAQIAFPIPGASGGTVAPSFIFDSLNGTISAWNPSSTGGKANAVIAVRTPGAVYTGLALATMGSAPYLYAADATAPPNGGIKVFNSSFNPVTLGSDAFSVTHLPWLPSDEAWAPYNVANFGANLLVSFVPVPTSGGQPIAGNGNGVLAQFTTAGQFVGIVAWRGPLNDPWGMVMAPAQFGAFSNDLLIGNFGDGKILAYRQHNDRGHDGDDNRFTFAGELRGGDHKPLSEGFLWALWFGNGANGFDADTLYFTTGGDNQTTDGLFAALSPEPSNQH
jgi:uncharacterized protein (TIGR03118 family)